MPVTYRYSYEIFVGSVNIKYESSHTNKIFLWGTENDILNSDVIDFIDCAQKLTHSYIQDI